MCYNTVTKEIQKITFRLQNLLSMKGKAYEIKDNERTQGSDTSLRLRLGGRRQVPLLRTAAENRNKRTST